MSLRSPQPQFFSSLLPEMATRAARSTVSRLGFSNSALRRYLTDLFSATPGEPGCFVGEPVFEATFGWEPANVTMGDLGQSLLDPDLIRALDKPGGSTGSDYRFARDARPYAHQLAAWELLTRSDPQSVIVTSGTGSGKTECFMVPILDSLSRAAKTSAAPLEGVQALFLYPLNALIQSQQERLHAWTAPFDGKVRFCLYNGNTPNTPLPSHKTSALPNQVLDRKNLRMAPPPILVTNATMLEYMLVRAQDAPILKKSQGKLQWVVLDEAHSYIGSQAAELALLLRRVLHAFGVQAGDVRFVATSATIGDPKGEAGTKLRDFLAGLAGVSHDRVHVVAGQRRVPELPVGNGGFSEAGLEALEAIPQDSDAEMFDALCANGTARSIRKLFIPSEGGRPANPLGAVCDVTGSDRLSALRWLDVLTRTRGDSTGAFLPLRLHAFHNVLNGIWACCDPGCTERRGTLDSPDWSFGAVYTEERESCVCGSPVFEIRSCNECNETFLWGERVFRSGDGRDRLLQAVDDDYDEFRLDVETDTNETTELDQESSEPRELQITEHVLIANGHTEGTGQIQLEKRTRIIDAPDAADTIVLRTRDQDHGLLVCPKCGAHHGDGKMLFRPARLGAPFLLMQLIPTLLEYCPDGDEPLARPMRGRRMITFTDSRQGTARTAATLQQDAERNRVRSLVYEHAHRQSAGESPELKQIDEMLAGLREHPASPLTEKLIADYTRRRDELGGVKPVPFAKMAEFLAQHEDDINRWALAYYRDLDPATFSGDRGALTLAELFLAREFSRRPKRANSLETMGLVSVQYPKLQSISQLPSSVSSATNLTLEEWRQFLKLALDFHVRENSYIAMKSGWYRFIGKKFLPKQLLHFAHPDKQTSTLRRWPQCNPVGIQSRLVRLLSVRLLQDPQAPEGRDLIDRVLQGVWEDMIRVGLLRGSSNGRFLDLEDVAFAPIAKGWLCPVTRRVLDVTVQDLTPYLPPRMMGLADVEGMKCDALIIPSWPGIASAHSSEQQRLLEARHWLATSEEVVALRNLGVWSSLNDRVVEGNRYFRTAEHSAQQSGEKLSDYEAKFKSGYINLLSCSTTMEMGVDIGGMSVVAMNNVPPHPANYLQRAGRAGRRAETRSVAVTLCKSNPHDQYVFSSPLWPFITPLPAPAIRLQSPVIVQRHFNSMLLAHFLWERMQGATDLNKLDMEWWSLPKGESFADKFAAWTRCFADDRDPDLSRGLRFLLRHTCFDGAFSLGSLAARSADAMVEALGEWYGELAAIDEQLAMLGAGKDAGPAKKALEIQRKRLTGEYLLRELAGNGFLPGYGFPTDITSFDTLNFEALDRQRQLEASREDNKMRHRDLPSRDAVTALREYAPGADIVMDGLVYRSAGITLNWHAPASEAQVKEIQSIRHAWRCSACGASGTSANVQAAESCPTCGETLKGTGSGGSRNLFTYLEPAGFAVDLYEPTHNDVSAQSFVPVEMPWINADGEWRPLPNPTLGAFRSSPTGRVFNHSAGLGRKGYAICLECGRAEPMPGYPDESAPERVRALPKLFRTPHKRLRGKQSGTDAECKGSFNPYSIKPYVHLGMEVVTDVLEVRLNDGAGRPLTNSVAAYSIAVALRSAAASDLGVEIGEIGTDIKPVKHGGVSGFSIVMYDRNSAGYCSSLAERLTTLLRMARSRLLCSAECPDACQRCLLTYDTRFRLADLDRFAALAFLTEDWLQQLALREEDAFFGAESSVAETEPLAEAISREWEGPTASELRLYLGGEVIDWDLPGSPLRKHLHRWALDRAVRLIVPAGAIKSLSMEARLGFALATNLENLTVHEPATTKPGLLAEIVCADGVVAFASRDPSCGIPAAGWGHVADSVLVRGRVAIADDVGPAVSVPFDAPKSIPKKAGRLDLRGECNGPAEAMGTQLLERIEGVLDQLLIDGEGDIQKLIYRDRYLNSPLPGMLLISFIAALKQRLSHRWGNPPIEIVTVEVPDDARGYGQPTMVQHNWRDTATRDAALRAGFDYCGMTAVVRVLDKQAVPHARVLEIGAEGGNKLRIWFDQGFGYWNPKRIDGRGNHYLARFPFGDSIPRQGNALGLGQCPIEGQAFSTHVFFEKAP
jgi:DEAD/DEAH box helicase domain-containing protein